MKRIVLALVWGLLTMVAVADEQAAKALNARLTAVSSLQADFQQETLDARGSKQQVLQGKMSVKRPGYFRWDTTSPFPQLIIADGSRVWLYDPDLAQVTVQKMDKQVGNTPALLLSGDPSTITRSFDISQTGEGASEVYVLKPKAKDALFESLQVTFDGKGVLQGMALKDSLGSRTLIRFGNVKLNPSLDRNLFKFRPPKGVDVINEG